MNHVNTRRAAASTAHTVAGNGPGVSTTSFSAGARAERQFGIGYGRSSGYVRSPSYVPAQPAYFRCR